MRVMIKGDPYWKVAGFFVFQRLAYCDLRIDQSYSRKKLANSSLP